MASPTNSGGDMKDDLIKKKNVVLVFKDMKTIGGLRTTHPAIVVGVTEKVPLSQLSAGDQVPKLFHGMETDVIEVQMPQALRTTKHRPMPGGVSGGHPKVTAGTISPLTVHGIRLIISNNHVIANCGECEMGDETWQPGRVDGGSSADTIGHLWRWAQIHFADDDSTCPVARLYAGLGNLVARLFHRQSRLCTRSLQMNKVDCAASLPIIPGDLLNEILEIGVPTGFAKAITGESIAKSGRTTGLTPGSVISTEGEAKVSYGSRGVAVYDDQIITTKIAEGGDSGSLVFNSRKEVIGMLFAGSNEYTIVNKIQHVLEALGLEGVSE